MEDQVNLSLPPFNPEPHDSCATRWDRWLKRFNNFVVAKNIEEDKRKQAMLLHYGGEEVFEIHEALSVEGDAIDTYPQLTKKLTEYFAPKRNTEYEVYLFRQSAQQHGETLDKFYARLLQMSRNCDFGDAAREIKSQIIQKCALTKVRDKGLRDTNLVLTDLLQFGRTLEATTSQVKAMGAPSTDGKTTSAVNRVDTRSTSKTTNRFNKTKPKGPTTHHTPTDQHKTSCPGCGSAKGHTSRVQQCPAWGKECRKCSKNNHFASVCRGGTPPSAQHQSTTQHKSTAQPTARNNFVQDVTDVPYSSQYPVYTVQSKSPRGPYVCVVKINGAPTAMEIDTGASLSLVSVNQYKQLPCSVPLDTTNIPTLRTYSGDIIQPLGRCVVNVEYKSQIYELSLLVVPGDGPNLLGRDWLHCVNLNWSELHRVEAAPLGSLPKLYPQLFSNELGCVKNISAKLVVDVNATPRCFKPRPVPYALQAKVETELERLQSEGVIRPVEFSDWAAPIVPVLKSNGEIRICGDYKLTVNAAAKVDKYPIPNIKDLYAKLSGGKYYSKLDLSHAYQQVPLDEDSQRLTTITTSKGLFAYTRMCYGVSSAPGIFQRIMEQVLQGMPMVAVYLDDILVTGTSYDEARRNLHAVLQRLQDAGLTLKLEKCEFMQDSVVYLGHKLDAEGIRPTEEKTTAIQNAPAPTNVSELRSYLGMVNHYHPFLPNISAVLAPLHELLHKDTHWHWGKPQQEAFEHSKVMFRSPKLLVHYNPNLPLVLTCDASPYGIGSVLSHTMPDGVEKPVAFASRTLIPAEKNYAQIERESLAIIFGVTKFHKYIYGRDFTILSDHKPLLGLLHEQKAISPTASARIQHWALLLANYRYHLRYRPGPQIANADGLSRLPINAGLTSVPVPEETILALSTLANSNTPVTAKLVAQWVAKDPILALVAKYLREGWLPAAGEELAPYFHRRNELSLEQGCILWGSRVVIPPPGRDTILADLHETHPGIVRMKALARSYIWWPGMDKEIENTVRSCHSCQQQAVSPPKGNLHPWEWPGKPWHRLHIDYAGPVEGKMLLIIVDAHSKFIECHIVSSANSANTIIKLLQTFATHGLPAQLVSDNGSPFTSEEFAQFCRNNGIQHIRSAPYHPASNGLAERAVQTVKNGLRKTVGPNLETRLYRFLAMYRLTPQTTTGESPAELLLKRRPRSRLDLTCPDIQGKVLSKQSSSLRDRCNERSFFCGDAVWSMNFAGAPKWLPGVLETQTGPVSFTVRLSDGRLWKRHIDHLRQRLPHEPQPEPLDTDEPAAQLPVPRPDAIGQPLTPELSASGVPANTKPAPHPAATTLRPNASSSATPTRSEQARPPDTGISTTPRESTSTVPPLRRSSRASKPPVRLDL